MRQNMELVCLPDFTFEWNKCTGCGRPTINKQVTGPRCPDCWQALCIEEEIINEREDFGYSDYKSFGRKT